MNSRRAFSLLEVLFALTVLTLAGLSLLSVCGSAVRASRKSETLAAGHNMAERMLNRAVSMAQGDDRARFWGENFPSPNRPFLEGTEGVGKDVFTYKVFAVTVPGLNTSGTANRLKKLDAVVSWENGANVVYAVRLVGESETL